MTDGPFRNAQLNDRWKRFGQDLVNDTTSIEERVSQASHSMLGDVDMDDFHRLYAALSAHAALAQLEFDPIGAVERILEQHPPSIAIDHIQRHLLANLRDGMALHDALEPSLLATTHEWIGVMKNRIDEECIRARDTGDMSQSDYVKGIERTRETFKSISSADLAKALAEGKKSAFRRTRQKAVDEGPEE